jgi:amino-acid N-acetyltransferase
VAVRETCRRKGIGSLLVKGALARVRALAPADVTVLTLTPEFFATLGFREIPKTRIMHKLYTGCINCTKHTDPFTCPERAMALEMPKG